MKQSLKYMDIVSWAKEQIALGTFQPGKKFFSENRLGEVFGFSRQTVRRALEELEELGYIMRVKGSGTYVTEVLPDTGLKSSANESVSRVIGIISTHLDAYIFPSIIEGLEKVLNAAGYITLLTSTKNKLEGETRALDLMLDRHLDGLIVEPTKSGLPCINLEQYQTIAQRGIPIVFIDSCYPDFPAPYVALDDEEAGYRATKHLINLGHKKIAGLFTFSDRQGQLRFKGYARALKDHGLGFGEEHVLWYSKETMLQSLYSDDLWDILSDCTAAFCYNDSLALILINQLRQKGLKVPEDFSVVGVDNSEQAQMNSITSISHPGAQLGEAAANLLLSMIRGEEGKSILFPPDLVSRNSVCNKEKRDESNQ